MTIGLEAGPVYRLLMAEIRSAPSDPGRMVDALSFGEALVFHLFSGWWVMKKGIQSLPQPWLENGSVENISK